MINKLRICEATSSFFGCWVVMFGVILRSFWVANDHTWNKKFGCKCNEARGCEATLSFFVCAIIMFVVILITKQNEK